MADSTVVKLDVPERIPITFQLQDRLIDGAMIKPLSFASFVDCVTEAQAMTSPKTFEARIKRVRMMRQVSFYMGNVVTPLTIEEILRMPIPAARVLLSKIDDDVSPIGKITRMGDGMDQSIVYELGTPIPIGQGKSPIKELEFQAKTYGEIEDVLAAPSRLHQALLMLRTIAKPLGTSLQQLPEWAANQVLTGDGFTITNEVVPPFLESPEE